ncbi:putative pyruvate carboxylase [Pyronema domesticum]|uniref:Similar to Pyruvate carboxylase subunit A acc. no. Q58626 n=1 Tax=Pyronema omphalodes (strain CBS 100304) TaxID=1076935 RepID=U4L2S1_PYROM|nr:putative pyruvate carboxylase [Pyronema domesticum]CCX04365.1 Similar to Pyruvate carboxylase subunit A; acc. no. Q58626 [Pyronema omphalodes CBS 100304]
MVEIKKLLVANRGEIAIRILHAARELGIETVTLHTTSDTSHTHHAHASLLLPSPTAFTDIPLIISLARSNGIDAIHPGYGFLSESPVFSLACKEVDILFVGPSTDILNLCGSKTDARNLATSCGVPVLKGLEGATNDINVAATFAGEIGYPVVIKAVDGGGGRGIRRVSEEGELADAFKRCVNESPSGRIFVEKAASVGARHVEVQIVGDSHGGLVALGTRECSVQRRFQKVVEFCALGDERLEGRLCAYALKMAQRLGYQSLGTFEFLVDGQEIWFLEVNPRLQVEHTITEEVFDIDLIQLQLSIAAGGGVPSGLQKNGCSIQLRITAEDPSQSFALSLGKISTWVPPHGRGVRVETHLRPGTSVSAELDSLLAKIIITASTWKGAVAKANRALEDTLISGVKTNLPLLLAVVSHLDFITRNISNTWLESHLPELLGASQTQLFAPPQQDPGAVAPVVSLGAPLLRKGNAWTLSLSSDSGTVEKHSITISRLLQNDFPTLLAAEVVHRTETGGEKSYKALLKASTADASLAQRRKGDPGKVEHIIVPFAGEVVELGVKVGERVKKGQVVVVVRQMKTELEVRAHRDGVVRWGWDVKEGDRVEGGELVAEVAGEVAGRSARL